MSAGNRPWSLLWPRKFKITTQSGTVEERTEYLKVGVAFPHRDGQGYSIELYFRVIPGGDLVLMPPREPRQQTPDEPPPELDSDGVPF
jgi:hypothetical protein